MINKHTNTLSEPFLLKPAGKDYLWGGGRLKSEYGKESDLDPLAETWECSTHPDGLSRVGSGIFAGQTLKEVVRCHPVLLGPRPLAKGEGELPILIKFIDARQDLSVQVHPDDAYARENENGQRGKTEMWYVADAGEESELVFGWNQDLTKKELEKALKEGTVEGCLRKVRIHKDDVFLIEAGTVHAIGAGALVVEVQESSNLTYRIYDYNRRDKEGKTRELHIKKALDVASRKKSRERERPLRVRKYRTGAASEVLCRCPYFQVEHHLLNTETARRMAVFSASPDSFQVFVCLEGRGVLCAENGAPLHFFKGDTIFVPASSLKMKFHGKAGLLSVIC